MRWVSESLRPFEIVSDCSFVSLMKTGRPKYYLPSPSTVSCDVRLIFARTWQWIAKMLKVSVLHVNDLDGSTHRTKEYEGRINFTTNVWSSPNHWAFVAFSVHLEHNGVSLTFLLDVVEVAKVHGTLAVEVHVLNH